MPQRSKGLTLIEVLLALVISSAMILLFINFTTRKADQMRIDKTVLQMNQIINSALAFYTRNGSFNISKNYADCGAPESLSETKLNDIAPGLAINPYGYPYVVGCDMASGSFWVGTHTSTRANATIVANSLAGGYIAGGYGPGVLPGGSGDNVTFYAVTYTPPPGQNLTNARSINFAGIYHSGACVPAPNCPTGMKPAIYVAPAGVSGVNDAPTCTGANAPRGKVGVVDSTCTANIYPVSSFVAFVRGKDATGEPGVVTGSGSTAEVMLQDCSINSPGMVACNSAASDATSSSAWSLLPSTEPTATKYWRVCLVVYTERGYINPSNNSANFNYNQGRMLGTILAITRCVPSSGEFPSGSPIEVWSPNAAGQN